MAICKTPLGSILNREILLSFLFVASLCSCNSTFIHKGENGMSDLTRTTRPICFGRLVIEIPASARITRWSQEVDYTIIESADPVSLDRKSFDAKIAQREELLKTSPNDADGVLLKSRIHLTPDSELLVYREGKVDHRMYQLDAAYWRPEFEYLFHSETTNKYLADGIDRVSNVVNSFVPMPTEDLASLPPGLCIEHGVITGSEFRGESVEIKGHIDEYPGVTFSFSTQSTDQPPEEPSALQRVVSAFAMIAIFDKEFSASTRFLRKGKRKLNGQSGEEMVAVNSMDGRTIMDAKATFFGEPNSLDKPEIEVKLTYEKRDGDTHEPSGKNPTEKAFLALWDALLNGIKPRPKGLLGADAIKK